MLDFDRIWMAEGEDNPCYLLLNQANRHGLIAGASGTGKTVTFKVMAEAFSQAGVPVFMADVKGDVAGMAEPGVDNEGMQKRIKRFGIQNWEYRGCPVRLWDIVDGSGAIPIRITVSDIGPVLLSRMLDLSEVQEGVLNIVFRIADDNNWLLVDLKDLRAMLNYVAEHSDTYQTLYGNVSASSVGAILRALIAIEDQGGDYFFGEPSIDLDDWFAVNEDGEGYINILNAVKLVQSPQIYSIFLLWMMTELFDTLPEVGDLDKPKFVFFFDEAHLLFKNVPKTLVDKIIQVVKLVRSKGVGIYFITQSPSDIPDEVLAQLSNRVQHGLRAYTPAEQKAVRAAAQAFRQNPNFDAEQAILELGTGEALVSFLDEEGRPSVVENAKILPPQCLMAAPSATTILACLDAEQDLIDKYGMSYDPVSAYEIISAGSAELAGADMTGDKVPVDPEMTRDERIALERAAKEAEAERARQEREAERELARRQAAAQKEREKAQREAAKEAERRQAAIEKELERARREEEKEVERRKRQLEREIEAERARKIREAQKAAEKAERERQRAAEKAERERQKQEEQLRKELISFGRSAGREILRGLMGTRRR